MYSLCLALFIQHHDCEVHSCGSKDFVPFDCWVFCCTETSYFCFPIHLGNNWDDCVGDLSLYVSPIFSPSCGTARFCCLRDSLVWVELLLTWLSSISSLGSGFFEFGGYLSLFVASVLLIFVIYTFVLYPLGLWFCLPSF